MQAKEPIGLKNPCRLCYPCATKLKIKAKPYRLVVINIPQCLSGEPILKGKKVKGEIKEAVKSLRTLNRF